MVRFCIEMMLLGMWELSIHLKKMSCKVDLGFIFEALFFFKTNKSFVEAMLGLGS